jgi:hypothetical protein
MIHNKKKDPEEPQTALGGWGEGHKGTEEELTKEMVESFDEKVAEKMDNFETDLTNVNKATMEEYLHIGMIAKKFESIPDLKRALIMQGDEVFEDIWNGYLNWLKGGK